MKANPEPIDLNAVPHHMRGDYHQRNELVLAGKPLCDRCEGTGNELLSMYRKCRRCGGTGEEPAGVSKDCPACDGDGKTFLNAAGGVSMARCPTCGGTGEQQE